MAKLLFLVKFLGQSQFEAMGKFRYNFPDVAIGTMPYLGRPFLRRRPVLNNRRGTFNNDVAFNSKKEEFRPTFHETVSILFICRELLCQQN